MFDQSTTLVFLRIGGFFHHYVDWSKTQRTEFDSSHFLECSMSTKTINILVELPHHTIVFFLRSWLKICSLSHHRGNWSSHTASRKRQQFDSRGWESFAMAFSRVILCPKLLTPNSFSSDFLRSGKCIPWMSFSLKVSLYCDISIESSQLQTSVQSQSNTAFSIWGFLKEIRHKKRTLAQ